MCMFPYARMNDDNDNDDDDDDDDVPLILSLCLSSISVSIVIISTKNGIKSQHVRQALDRFWP